MQGNQVNAFNCYHSAVIVNHETKRLFKSDQIWNQWGCLDLINTRTRSIYVHGNRRQTFAQCYCIDLGIRIITCTIELFNRGL